MERMAEKEEGEQVESPEVAAARAEVAGQPLAEEDLGEEAAAAQEEDDADDADDADGGDDDLDDEPTGGGGTVN
jgi:hypothetical protein